MREGEASQRKAPVLYLQPQSSSQGTDGETKARWDVGRAGIRILFETPSPCSKNPLNHCSLGRGHQQWRRMLMGVPLGTGEALTLVGFLALLLRMQNPGCSLCGHFSGLHLEGGTQRDLTAHCKMGVPQTQGSSAMTPTSCGYSSHLYPYRIMQGPGARGPKQT